MTFTSTNSNGPGVTLELLMQLKEEMDGMMKGVLSDIRGGTKELEFLAQRIPALTASSVNPFPARLILDESIYPGMVDMVFGSGRKQRVILWEHKPSET